MKLFILLALTSLAVACNNDSTTTNTEKKTTQPAAVAATCYMGTSGKDSVILTLRKDNEDVATGELSYLFYEKDKSRGTFSGRMKGDTLFADYTYSSEGTQSTREIAFLQKDNTLTEGYGDATEIGGKMTFKNPSDLQFGGTGFVLSKVDCK
jgi:hypothetical protein